ncbi:MAG: hypothetical protein M3Q10_14010, partial [Chloroflexota bacterium]|nr:hypothetical protein [Chloroflexota bacterium]
PRLLAGLEAVADGPAALELRLNAGALAEVGRSLETGAAWVAAVLRGAGFAVDAPRLLGPADLPRYPTSWAKRLVFGRDPRAVAIEATVPGPNPPVEVRRPGAVTGWMRGPTP